jgi:hypothetical protein
MMKGFCLVILITGLTLFYQSLFHHSLDRFFLSVFQRITANPRRFSGRITIIDTSPLFNIEAGCTDRAQLAELLNAVRAAEPAVVGLDVLVSAGDDCGNLESDSLLGNALSGWDKIIIPEAPEIGFDIPESQQASVRMYNGYEVDPGQLDKPPLAFRMAEKTGLRTPPGGKKFVIRYMAAVQDTSLRKQMFSASDLLRIWRDPKYSDPDRKDELAMILGSQYVLIGFNNDLMNIDRHDTPLETQPGIWIWANMLNSLIQEGWVIRYSPPWALAAAAVVIFFIVLFLKRVHDHLRFFEWFFFTFSTGLQIVFWPVLSGLLFAHTSVYIPVFSVFLAGLTSYPIWNQVSRTAGLIRVALQRPLIAKLPAGIRHGYVSWLLEENPFKKLHLGFNLLEECIRFSAVFGVAYAGAQGLVFPDVLRKKHEKHQWERLSMGRWHDMLKMSSLIHQHGEAVPESWKRIYLARDNKQSWAFNALCERIENNLDRYEMIERVRLNRGRRKPAGSRIESAVIHLYLRIRLFCSGWAGKISRTLLMQGIQTSKRILEKRMGAVTNMIQLRNRMVHYGGVFLSDVECRDLLPLMNQSVGPFIRNIADFWKSVRIREMKPDAGIGLFSGASGIPLHPFVIQRSCDKHGTNESFLWAGLDYHTKKIYYQGQLPSCRIEVQSEPDVRMILSLMGYSN